MTNLQLSLPVLQELRAVKTQQEISFIVKAQRLSERVLQEVLGKLKPGISEVYLARFIAASFKKLGVKALAFSPIVGFGAGTADIHHEPGRAQLALGSTIMFDFGATLGGYCSDMTRTYFYGQATPRQRRVYQSVLTAQERALKSLSSGEKSCFKIDRSARQYLTQKFGRRGFPHGLGHGVGTAIHEWPNFKPTSTDTLKAHVVMTVEPGIYIKGWGGVRIEDMVLIKSRGMINLTHAPKKLGEIIIRA